MVEPSSIRSRLGGTRGSILDTYGGEYEWDGYTIKLHSERGSDKGVTLRYGKNITDITQEENIENTITISIAAYISISAATKCFKDYLILLGICFCF